MEGRPALCFLADAKRRVAQLPQQRHYIVAEDRRAETLSNGCPQAAKQALALRDEALEVLLDAPVLSEQLVVREEDLRVSLLKQRLVRTLALGLRGLQQSPERVNFVLKARSLALYK